MLGSPSRTRTLPGPRSLWRYSYFDMIKRKLWLLPLALAWHTTPALLIGQNSAASPLEEVLAVPPQPIDFNKNIYYRNKLEFSLETGALPINIPFVFDIFVGGDYSQRPLHYTLVPIFPSLRWQMGDIKGPGILRGNTDLTATISVTAIPRGPEKIYGAFDLGVRRILFTETGGLCPTLSSASAPDSLMRKNRMACPTLRGRTLLSPS